MKNLVTFLLMLAFIAVGCQQPEPEIHTVDVGFFTPYALYPETLNGKIKQLTERNYLAVEKDGNVIKDERLNKESRDSLSWTRDFRLSYNEDGMMTKLEYLDENDKTTSMDEITLKDKNIISGNYTHLDTLRHIFRVSYDEEELVIMKCFNYHRTVLAGLQKSSMMIMEIIKNGSCLMPKAIKRVNFYFQ